MSKSLQKMSVSLCYFLRHDPGKIDLYLDSQGWANIEELIAKSADHCPGLDRQTLLKIVADDAKGRYGLSEDGVRIRCVQGHSSTSVKIKHTTKIPPPVLYHGTASRFYEAIMKKGLLPGKRQHVHLSTESSTAIEVGKRHGEPVVLQIDTRAMVNKGYSFFLADNGIWLIESVPAQFIQRI
ncbi:MAG: RNA 2'-phosphotransferase [Hafnia sp.]